VDTARKFIDGSLLATQVIDANLRVGDTSTKAGLWVWLVLAVAIATGRTTTHYLLLAISTGNTTNHWPHEFHPVSSSKGETDELAEKLTPAQKQMIAGSNYANYF